MPKYCIDCKWSIMSEVEPRCSSPKSERKVNLVTGQESFGFCQVERMGAGEGLKVGCGEAGNYWEAKES